MLERNSSNVKLFVKRNNALLRIDINKITVCILYSTEIIFVSSKCHLRYTTNINLLFVIMILLAIKEKRYNETGYNVFDIYIFHYHLTLKCIPGKYILYKMYVPQIATQRKCATHGKYSVRKWTSSLPVAPWWRHQMEIFSSLPALCVGNPPAITKASVVELWCFLWSVPEQMLEQTIETQVFWEAIALIMTSLYCIISQFPPCVLLQQLRKLFVETSVNCRNEYVSFGVTVWVTCVCVCVCVCARMCVYAPVCVHPKLR